MLEIVRYSVNGTREVLEQVLLASRARGGVKDYPACSALFAEVERGAPAEARLEGELSKYGLRSSKMNFFFPTEDELATCGFFHAEAIGGIHDVDGVMAKPAYSGRDACPDCGKGSVELIAPLRVFSRKLDGAKLVRYLPGLFLASIKILDLAEREGWTGVEFRPVLEGNTGEECEKFRQLVVASTLPALHPSGALVRNTIPKFCERCRRLGYQLPGPQLVYATTALADAKDWNVSEEWTSANFVSGPELVCSRRVVHELLKLAPSHVWLPVKLVD